MAVAYNQYKHDTESVAGWLAERSALAGYSSTTNAVPAKLGRTTSRVPKSGKKAKPEYKVKVAEFVDMAKCIITRKPRFILTRAMQSIWKRAIQVRRKFVKWFSSQDDTDAVLDDQHSHFAFVLETTLEILRPCYEVPKEQGNQSKGFAKPKNRKGTPLGDITNIYKPLETEDIPSEEEQDQDDTATMARSEPDTDSPRAQIDFNDKEAESEFFFAIWTFMLEVYAVRIYVASTWRLYVGGTVELMQAASVTNLAVDLVRRAEADLEASLQRPPAYPATKYPTGSLPYLIFKLHRHHFPDEGPTKGVNADLPMAVIICGCVICNFLLYVPWAAARAYIHVLKAKRPTFPTPENDFRVQVPPFPATSVVGKEFYHAKNPSQQALDRLSEILPNFSLLCLMLRGTFIEDEILHAARHILETRKTPIWVSLALQIQLDIEQLGEVKTVPAFRDLKQIYEVIKLRSEVHKTWHESLGVEVWHETWHNHVQKLVDDFGQWIKGKTVGKSDGEKVRQLVDAGTSMKDAIRASGRVPLLENFPVTCATMKTELLLEWHTLGLKFVNYTGHVPMLCHLYNALRIIDEKAPVWPDMELLIRNQTPARVFIGGKPKTLDQASNRFFLSMGVSAASLAKDSRQFRMRNSRTYPREFEQSPIARNLFDRWLGRESRKVDEAAYQLQELLFSAKYQQDLELNNYVMATSADKSDIQKYGLLKTKMVRTLSSLSRAFSAEMPALLFDYFSMQRKCYGFFPELDKDVQAALGSGYGDDPKNHCNPFRTTSKLFRSAVDSEHIVRTLASKDKAMSRAAGPMLAKHMKSMLSSIEKDDETEASLDKMLKHVRNGQMAQALGEFADLSENASAVQIFKPVRRGIDRLLSQQQGDLEVVKLQRLVGKSDYGIFFFRQPSLEALYGPGQNEVWKDLTITDEAVEKAMERTADNPFFALSTMLFLYQEKVMCGLGEDSHEKSGRRAVKLEDAERRLREDWLQGNQDGWADQIGGEEWEKWVGIYGKQGRFATE